jgi:hypothetical protein
MSHGDEVERLMVGGEGKGGLNLVIVEGAHGHRPQVQSHGLEEDVLAGVACLQLDVALGPATVFFAALSCVAVITNAATSLTCSMPGLVLSQVEGPQPPRRATDLRK